MIETLSVKAIEGAAHVAVEKATEIQTQREMSLLLQQQETMRLGEISAREVLHREVITERESVAAEELQARMDAESQGVDAPDDNAAGESPAPMTGDIQKGLSAWDTPSGEIREEAGIKETSLESNRSIYEAAGVDVGNPFRQTLVDKEYTTHKIPRIEGGLVGPDGTSNFERSNNGLAAYIDVDGRFVKVELHHHRQQQDGPFVELDSLTHRRHHSDLHPGLGKGEGRGEDSLWSQRVSEYWKQRDFTN